HHHPDHAAEGVQHLGQAGDKVAVLRVGQLLQAGFQHGLALGHLGFGDGGDAVGRNVGAAGHPLGGGVGDVDVVVRTALLQGGVGHFGGGHADDGKLVGTQLEGLADGVAAVGHPGDVIAHHTDPLVLGAVHVLDAPALGDLGAGHAGVGLADAYHAGLAVVLGAHPDRRAGAVHADHRRDTRDRVRPLFGDPVHLIPAHVAGPGPWHAHPSKAHAH